MHPDIRSRLREIASSFSVAGAGVTGVSGVTGAVTPSGHTPSHLGVTPSEIGKTQQNQRATPVTPCDTLEATDENSRHTLAGVAGRVTNGAAAESLVSEDWRAHFEERAAIREYEGGIGRVEAERLAMKDTAATLGPEPQQAALLDQWT